MTLFKICTFILFYFIVRLAFTPSTSSLSNNYDESDHKVTTAQVAFLTE